MKYLLILFFILSAGMAQGQVATSVYSNQDIFQRNLYSADRIMGMREELELTDAQVANIKKAYSKNAGEFSTLKWDLDAATLKLKNLLDQPKIDQEEVQKQMDAVLKLENQLKKLQLDNLVSIKNELTEEQQESLQSSPELFFGRVSGVQSMTGGQAIQFGQNGLSQTKVIGYPAATSIKSGGAVSPSVSVHVAGSAKDGNEPMYFLDTKNGMKPIKEIKDIEPNNIESISVLKGDAAIEKFGEKAKNGAIVIKLKNEPK